MVEATQQADRAVKAWVDTQMKVWESWVDAVESTTTSRSGLWDQVRKSTLDALQQSVSKTLDAQAELTHVLSQSLAGIWTTSEDATNRARIAQISATTKTATEAQKQLWASWFDMAKKVDASQFGPAWQKVLEAWQKAIRTALDAQAQWFHAEATERNPATSATKS